MKKAFTAIISIVLCVSTLASCANSTVKKLDDATNIITDTELEAYESNEALPPSNENINTDVKPENDTSSEVTPPKDEPSQNDGLSNEKCLTSEDIGFRACRVSVSDSTVASATVDENGGVSITALALGRSTITIKNSYGEEVAVDLSVNGDGYISSLDYAKYSRPENSVIATEFGMDSSLADNAPALQAAIDAVGENGTVYIPAGRYAISLIELTEGLTLRLEGVSENYNTALTPELAKKINEGDGIAVLVTKGSTMLVNHKKDDYARTGVDNITLIGGAYDMEGKSTCFVFCCGENITVKNTVVKDCFGGHAMQITGCKSFTVESVCFVGQNYSTNNSSGEIIQIENGYMGAITSNNTFSKFDEGETHISENVTISDCYFGKSDEFDAPTFAIGHHSQKYGIAARGVKILGCTFDNPRVQAVRTCAFSDVEIANNYFLSDRDNYVGDENGLYLLRIHSNAFKSENATCENGYLATSATFGGSNNISVHSNVFYIGEDSRLLGAIHITPKVMVSYDAMAFSNITLTDHYQSEGKSFTGYQIVTTKSMNISIFDNDITVKNSLGTCVFDIRHVSGLTMTNNTVNTSRNYKTADLDGVAVFGAVLYNCTSVRQEALSVAIRMLKANTTVPVVLTDVNSNINVFCNSSIAEDELVLTIQATDGGYLEKSVDESGVLYVASRAMDGYAFDGYYVNGVKISDSTYSIAEGVTVTANFIRV